MTPLWIVFTWLYVVVLVVLCAYGFHRYWILYLYWKHRDPSTSLRPSTTLGMVNLSNQISPVGLHKAPQPSSPSLPDPLPCVTVQLPIYNEFYVLPRLIESVCALNYPRELLEIQVLDDSTDQTQQLAQDMVRQAQKQGYNIHYLHRSSRVGFKAGALAWGLNQATGDFIAIFDADFTPEPDFLIRTLPHFNEPVIGMVQVRWGHLNRDYSLLTRLQSVFLDGHFVLEHTARNRSGAFFNFNGTAGIWRKEAILTSGGWQSDTLTEDLDLSYRAQMAGWRFVFLPEVVCPGELPVDIHSYRSQQYRWAKGSLQVAKKLLFNLLRRPLPWKVRLEACAHLTANLGYAFVVALLVLFLPSLIFRQRLAWPGLWMLEIGAFVLTVASIGTFYIVALREIYPDWRWRSRDLPALMAFGVGMCVNNARAVMHALFDVPSGFERTAKFNVRCAGEPWRGKLYRNRGYSYGLFEFFLLVYVFTTFLLAFEDGRWASLPFIIIYLLGLSYIGFLSWSHRRTREALAEVRTPI